MIGYVHMQIMIVVVPCIHVTASETGVSNRCYSSTFHIMKSYLDDLFHYPRLPHDLIPTESRLRSFFRDHALHHISDPSSRHARSATQISPFSQASNNLPMCFCNSTNVTPSINNP